jgi:nucleoside-diphosphate-sugar epimerase
MKLKDKKIVVVGGSGLIGNSLVYKLKSLGAKVESWNSDKHDIRNAENLNFDGVDYVFHLAVKMNGEKVDIYAVNVEGAKNLIEKAIEAKVKKLIYVSTIMVFEDTKSLVADEKYPKRNSHTSWYADSKIKALKLVSQYLDKLPMVVVYPSVVLDSKKRLIKPGSIMSLVGDKNRVTNYVDLDRLVDLLIKSLVLGMRGEDYILGGSNIKAKDYWWIGKFLRIPNFVAKALLGSVPSNMAFSSKKINSLK